MQMIFEKNKYGCKCLSTEALVKYKVTTSPSSTIEQGCLATSGTFYQASCDVYNYKVTAA